MRRSSYKSGLAVLGYFAFWVALLGILLWYTQGREDQRACLTACSGRAVIECDPPRVVCEGVSP
jgi:hypothetical protein